MIYVEPKKMDLVWWDASGGAEALAKEEDRGESGLRHAGSCVCFEMTENLFFDSNNIVGD